MFHCPLGGIYRIASTAATRNATVLLHHCNTQCYSISFVFTLTVAMLERSAFNECQRGSTLVIFFYNKLVGDKS